MCRAKDAAMMAATMTAPALMPGNILLPRVEGWEGRVAVVITNSFFKANVSKGRII
jgi:hypothetical protein